MIRRIVNGITLSGFAMAVTVAGQLLSVPILLAHWGVRTYGAWIALTNLASSIALMNLGIQSHVTNQLILMTARGQPQEAERLLGSALKVYAVFCVAALGVALAGLCFLTPSRLVDTAGMSRSESSSIVLAYSLLAIYGIVGGVLMNLLRVGRQLPRQLAYGTAERVVLLAVPIAIALGGAGPLEASWATVAILGLVEVLIVREVFRRTPVPISPSAGSLREGLRLVGPSLFFFGSALSTQLVATGITLIVSNAAGAVAVATFTTALMMTNLFRLILNQMVNVLSSEVTLLLGGEELVRLRNWYRFLWKGSVIITLAAATLLCPLGPVIIRLWTRGRVQIDSGLNLLLTLYLIAHAAGILSVGFGLAMNKQRRIFYVQLATASAALMLGAALVHKLGLHGIAWSLLSAQTLSTAALTLMNCRWLDQPAWQFLRDAVGRGIPAGALVLAGVVATYNLETLRSTLIAISLSLAGCLLLTWFTWLTSWERDWLRRSVRGFVQRKQLRPAGLAA